MLVFSGYKVSSPYGWRRNPINGNNQFHAGIDLVKSHRAPIYAFTEGTVIFAGVGQKGSGLNGYGNVVVVKDKNGYAQLYAHLDQIAVKKGTAIQKGQLVGYQGATGAATGSHLHYEVRKKSSPLYGWENDREQSTVDPTTYLKNYYDRYTVHRTVNGYLTALDAKQRKNKKSTVKPGHYYVFKRADGMINVTAKPGQPGSWINPNDNVPATNETYIVHKNLNGYYTAQDAKLRKNKKTTVKPGRYYVFKRADGMINVTAKPGHPGSWINPNDN